MVISVLGILTRAYSRSCWRIAGSPGQRAGPHIDLHIAMCKSLHMATNLALDDHLIEEARNLGGHKTKKDAVNAALAEYVRRHKQMEIVKLFGTIDYDPKYDYKAR